MASLLESGPFPQYQPHSDRPGLLMRIDANGRRTVGRFVKREFQLIFYTMPAEVVHFQ